MRETSRYHKTGEELKQEQRSVEAAQQDPSRFEPLYHTYYEPIFRFIYQRVGDRDTTADLTSQVFLKALSQLKKYRFRGVPFSSWLYRIAQHEVYEAFRREKARHCLSLTTLQAHEMLDEIDDTRQEAHLELLLRLLPDLPQEDLQLIELRFFEKRPFREIGLILDITENNAKVRTHRILEKLKRMFQTSLRHET